MIRFILVLELLLLSSVASAVKPAAAPKPTEKAKTNEYFICTPKTVKNDQSGELAAFMHQEFVRQGLGQEENPLRLRTCGVDARPEDCSPMRVERTELTESGGYLINHEQKQVSSAAMTTDLRISRSSTDYEWHVSSVINKDIYDRVTVGVCERQVETLKF